MSGLLAVGPKFTRPACHMQPTSHGLGWIGLGRDFSVFGGLGWVHYSKSTKNYGVRTVCGLRLFTVFTDFCIDCNVIQNRRATQNCKIITNKAISTLHRPTKTRPAGGKAEI